MERPRRNGTGRLLHRRHHHKKRHEASRETIRAGAVPARRTTRGIRPYLRTARPRWGQMVADGGVFELGLTTLHLSRPALRRADSARSDLALLSASGSGDTIGRTA